jgi:hypothetical protein
MNSKQCYCAYQLVVVGLLLCKVVQALATLLKQAEGSEGATRLLHIRHLKHGDVLVLTTCSNAAAYMRVTSV